nr:tRNA pseudouridine(38-40) synthase TruA [Chloroflexota bacterium]
MSRTVKLSVSYEGDRFAGSQFQPGQRTVQGELEAAWARCTGFAERATLAGRTDAGVHARAQAVSVVTQSDILVSRLELMLAHELPADLRVDGIVEMDAGFNARTSARWRMYEYDLAAATRQFLHRERMQEAAGRLLGEHDFMAFASKGVLGPRGAVRRLYLMAIRD